MERNAPLIRQKKPYTIDLTTSDQLGASVKEKIERELKFETDMDPRINALELYTASKNTDTLKVFNGIWPFLTEVSLKDTGEIVLHRTPANHNLLSPQLAREITKKHLQKCHANRFDNQNAQRIHGEGYALHFNL